MKKYILAFGAGLVISAPAFAADEYYIVRGPDKKCTVVETLPQDNTIVQVGPLAFSTRNEAERQVEVVCNEDDEDVVVERVVPRRERY